MTTTEQPLRETSFMKNAYLTADFLDSYGTISLFAVGVLGNLAAILVLTRRRLRHTVTSEYLTVLAISDLMALITGQGARHIMRTMADYDPATRHNLYCKLWYYFLYIFSSYSSWVLAGVSVERCLAVVSPVRARVVFTRKSSTVYLSIMFVCCLLYNSHMFFSYQVSQATYAIP